MERARTMKIWKFGNGTVPHNEKYGNLGMERSRTLKNMEIWEWNGPEQWNVWKFGNGMVPHNEKNGIRE